jgi:hypothetical protein
MFLLQDWFMIIVQHPVAEANHSQKQTAREPAQTLLELISMSDSKNFLKTIVVP